MREPQGQKSGITAGIRSRQVLRVALVAGFLHLTWALAFFAAGHEIRDFIRIGPNYVSQDDSSRVIEFDPDYEYPSNPNEDFAGEGYDGQFFYFIALDPEHARDYMDDPPYRYGRILYPLVARVLAAGQPDAIPYALLAINLLAVIGGTSALSAWLAARGSSPWLGLVYGLYPGLLIGLQRDLSEPLAYALVAGAIYLFDFGRRFGVLTAGLGFGLAALARESTIIFPALFAVSLLAGRPSSAGRIDRAKRLRLTGAFVALAASPASAWLAARWAWFGSPGDTGGRLTAIPFAGLIDGSFADISGRPAGVIFAALPAIVATIIAIRVLAGPAGRLEAACVLANVAVALVFAGTRVWDSYTGVGRTSTAVVLAVLLCIPYLRYPDKRTRFAMAGTAVLWLALTPVIYIHELV